ncbi:MAG: hypothetical protein J1G06_09820 [Oscillospiraceae bacterium]|nr:hypothetical protein [Oscillospiraceae bacterium]
MKDLKRKVMILNNLTSPYVSEAIIILKDYDPRFDTKAILDAERIVNEYLNKKNERPNETVRLWKKILKSTVLLAVMASCFIIGYLVRR